MVVVLDWYSNDLDAITLNKKAWGVAKKHLQTVAFYIAVNLPLSGGAGWLQISGVLSGIGVLVMVSTTARELNVYYAGGNLASWGHLS
ncbi:hypothetical protein KCE62_003158 [Salmonella enterica subsp. enterica serovar Newport]|nr:hypothetical protein [Salmonella enterica subsp. enterica serovar Newport]ECR5066449.1 hypothetical protein [Salmonella enterica]EDC6299192.1 hypothetical protein [Salmonella enterica subsp. enterica serovar Infantis]EEJ3966861.1 hypothetical protein [Salmonella enterica subsp. enterica serovar Gatuni]EHC5874241.1 hypothetical protein [Salmonella enterica subsp. enterica serovar Eastbourne]